MSFTKIDEAIFGSHAPYLCEHWTEENCDANNWSYRPSTYGVKGVHLVGDPHMILWDILKEGLKNPGREGGIDFAEAKRLMDDILENGINMEEGSMIYYDVDTMDKMNAFHRMYVSSELGIPGWMGQAVRFDSEAARIRFATKSNNRKYHPHNNTSAKDAECAVREVLRLENNYTKKAITDEVNDLGYHLPESTRETIANRLLVEFISCGQMKSGVRWIPHNKNTIDLLMPKLADSEDDATVEWYNNIWKNPDEICMIVYMSHAEGRIGSLLTSNVEALDDDKPLHILYSVPVPEGKETLATKREKVFSTHMASIEKRVLKSMGLGEIHRGLFRWNHPDSQHRFVEQDTNMSYNNLVYVKNRDFN